MPPECLLLPSLLAWVNQIPPGASLLAWNCWACEGLHELRPEVCFIFPAVREAGRKPELGCCFSPPPHQGQTQRDSPRHGCLSQGAARRLPCRSAKLPSRKRKRNRRGKKKKKKIQSAIRKGRSQLTPSSKPIFASNTKFLCVKGMRLEFIRYTDKTQLMMVLPCIFPLPTQGEVSSIRGYGIFPKPTNI